MDSRVLELLASRICHDLVSPVGAVNNGVEFLEEIGADALEDSLALIKYSAQQASAKLQAFRIVYGAGGRDPNIKPEDIQRAFSGLISADGKITQTWDPYGPLGPKGNPDGFCKMLMGGLIMAMECLPRGGTISVRPGDEGQTVVTAEGQDAGIREHVEDALNRSIPVDNLEPKLVHPYMLSTLAESYGFQVSIRASGPGKVEILLQSPS